MKMSIQKNSEEPTGVLVIAKHAGVTSHDIVNKIRHLYGTRRVGHTGTLDPMATGVLVVLVGRAAKAAEYLVSDKKTYVATLRLGLTTDTEDTTGNIQTQTDTLPSFTDLETILPQFIGKIRQIPPMYSALKVDGKKLIDLARKGITVERQAREIEIFSLSAEPTESPSDYKLTVTCSGGTYIRTLCADIGKALGCGGVMAKLERTATGNFHLESAHTIAELENLTPPEREACFIPVEALFEALPKICLPPFYERLCRGGCEIYLSKIKKDFPIKTRIRLCQENGDFFALGEVGEYENGIAVKAIKIFVLNNTN